MTSRKASPKSIASIVSSEPSFHLMFENHAAIMLLIEPQTGVILDANQAAVDFYGYPKAKLCGMAIQEINTLSPEQVAQERQKALAEARNYFVFQHRLASGEERIVEVHSSPISLQKGQVLFSIIHDITERKQMETQAQLQNLIVNATANAIMLTDTDGMIKWVNPAFSTLTGYSLAESINKNPRQLVKSGKQAASFYKNLWETILSGKVWRGEMVNRHKDGNLYSEELTITPLKDANGSINHFIAIKQDITARKRLEEALRESDRFARSIVDGLAEKIAILDESGSIVAVNRAWRELAGVEMQAPVTACEGANYLEVCDATLDPDAVYARAIAVGIRAVINSEQSEFSLEYPCEYSVGATIEKHWFSAKVTRFAGDGPVRVIIAHEDITARKQSEEQLQLTLSKYKTLFENFPLGISVTDEAGHILETNPIAEKMLAVPQHEQVQRGIDGTEWHIVRTDGTPMPPAEFASMRALKEKRVVENSEMGILKPDNTITWLSVTAAPLPVDGQGVVITYSDISTRKHAEDAALREAEWKFRALFENGPIGAAYHRMIYDDLGKPLDYYFIDANAKYIELTGVNPIGKNATEAFPGIEHDSFDWIGTFGHVAQTGEPVRFEQYLQSNKRWYDCVGYQYKPDHFVAAFLEITARKQAEAALRESEAKQSALIANIADVIAIIDQNGINRYKSPNIEKWFGWRPDELVGLSTWQNVHSDDLERTKEFFGDLLSQPNATGTAECRYQCKDGTYKWIELTAVNLLHRADIAGILLNYHDISERRKAEEARSESEARYQTLVESSPDSIGIHSEGKVVYVNPATLKLFHASCPEDLIGKPVLQLVHPDYRASVMERVRRSYENHQPASLQEEKFITLDGQAIDVEVTTTPIVHAGKPATQIIIRDITERKQAEMWLRESEAMLKKVQAVAHMGSWEIDLTTKTVIGSDEAHRIYGVEPGALTLALIQSVPLPEYRPLLDAALAALVKEGKRYDVEFKTHRLSDGEIRDIHSIAEYNPASRTIIGSVQDITERKRAEERIQQRVLELETINRISLAMRGVSGQVEMLSKVLDEILAILNTSHGSIELFNPAIKKQGKTVARGWMAQVTEQAVNRSDDLAGKVLTNGEIFTSREFASDPRIRIEARNQIPPGWGGATLPIRTTQQALGVLTVCVPSERELDKDELRLLSILSDMIGAALQRMQLYEETARRAEQLQALRVVDQAISSSHDLRLMLNVLLAQTISQLAVDAADVLLLQPGSDVLELAAGRGFHTLLFESINLNDSYAGRAILERLSILTLNINDAAFRAYPQFERLWNEERFACCWCVPLIVKGEIKGILEVYRRTAFTPESEWLEFLEALAGQAAIAINSTQLFENLQRSNLDLSEAYDATIEGWSRAMDLRDHETEGHTLRVTDLTVKLARAMQIGESQGTAIRRGALLHDIGKMGVPDAILLKPGILTEKEWVSMRKHPQLAHDMLTPIAYLKDAIDIPYCHHEKWDGTGYPQGLRGEQIPLSARIFAVVDVWDALTSDRPYRKQWTEQKTRLYILEQSGKHFDPQIVDIFLRIIGRQAE